ncbi:MAG: ATP-binding protein [Pseudomonadota bacterium]
MRFLVPKSLLGQVMVSVTLALLIAQVVAVTLLYRAGEERRESAAVTAAAFRLVRGAERRAALIEQREEQRIGPARANERFDRLPGPLRYQVTPVSPISSPPTGEEGERELRLREALSAEGIDPFQVATKVYRAGDDRVLMRFAADRPRLQRNTAWADRRMFVASIQRVAGGTWETVRILEPRRPQGALGVLVFQTLVTFAFLIIILYLVLRRITRPLARLTQRVSDFSRRPEQTMKLAESGPADTRRLIAAYNTMESRISGLLDEKDVMLGAIGHDLKTPLAALRVRIESVSDDDQRDKMAAGIEDITATLDDILALARVGRASDPHEHGAENVDLSALATSIAEEFEDMGDPVTVTSTERLVAKVQVTWIKRALRNLISNAVRYGGSAELSVVHESGHAVIRIDDKGPGIPEARISEMLEPFTRGEASRNRATGGAGLGLTLARAIVEAHSGTLELGNRTEGGLRVRIRLPMGTSS